MESPTAAQLRKATEARYGGPERTLHEAVKVKPALSGRPQVVGYGQSHGGYLPENYYQGVEAAREREVCCIQQS